MKKTFVDVLLELPVEHHFAEFPDHQRAAFACRPFMVGRTRGHPDGDRGHPGVA